MLRAQFPYYGHNPDATVETMIDTTVANIFTDPEEMEGHIRYKSGCASKSIRDVEDFKAATGVELENMAKAAYGDRSRSIHCKILKFAGIMGEPHIPDPGLVPELPDATALVLTPGAVAVGRLGAGPRDNSPQFPTAFRSSASRSHVTIEDLKLRHMDQGLRDHLKDEAQGFSGDNRMGSRRVKNCANLYSEVLVNNLGASPATAVFDSITTCSKEFDKYINPEIRASRVKTSVILTDSVGRFRRGVDTANHSKGRVVQLRVSLPP